MDNTDTNLIVLFRNQRTGKEWTIFGEYDTYANELRARLDAGADIIEDIDIVFFERRSHHMDANELNAYVHFRAVLVAWCDEHNIPYEVIQVGRLNKFLKNTERIQRLITVLKAFPGSIRS